jgi:hypothetical protein
MYLMMKVKVSNRAKVATYALNVPQNIPDNIGGFLLLLKLLHTGFNDIQTRVHFLRRNGEGWCKANNVAMGRLGE